ncbi:MAG: 4-hydroxy-3-methylbut-2-enyl diphosphate reductase [Chloroflexi bacterium RBG_13_54_8]|nr:MAG: 4-hydroxy-3-methylbut-2-enyl diphosphate reductase [Chloroflexi bacterium RBG_13_54_8]
MKRSRTVLIEKAKETGFCFGVKRALKILEEAIDKYGEVETLGPVVHNERVVDSLGRLGVKVVESSHQVAGRIAVIPSHGMPPQVSHELKARGLTIIDTTCPNVQRAQKAAKELSEAGFWVIVFGDPHHPEVKGILGWAAGKGVATLDSEAISKLSDLPHRLGLLSQTTRNPSQFARFTNDVINLLLPRIGELRVVNTICNVTEKRQTEAMELAEKADLMIVVGGRNSANTRCLAEVCSSTGTETHHVESAAEIQEEWFGSKTFVGVTTGTSIPDRLTQEVMLRLDQIRKRGLDAT